MKNLVSERHPLRLMFHKLKAMIAAFLYGFPSRNMYVIGVTGTKGKTTTTNFIANILSDAGYRVGMMSTVAFRVAQNEWVNESKMTTLSPFFIQSMLRKMVRSRVDYVVIEVSSHAIDQNRIWGINFDMAVLTNIGEDHLEYHGGFRHYLRTKGLLFARINQSVRKPKSQKMLILNSDDENFAYFDQFLADKKYTYGVKKGGTCYVKNIVSDKFGTEYDFHVPNDFSRIKSSLSGEFNIYNSLASATAALALGVSFSTIKASIEKMKGVPGRFEKIEMGQEFTVVVDYAHTVESLSGLLELAKSIVVNKLIVVFGATGGGRDKAKRTKMGEIADKYANMIILTDDDPYSEDSMKIINQISSGIKRTEGYGFWKIPNRFDAIKFALMIAKKDDFVVIAGKGAETVQIKDSKKIEWDDRKVVRQILSEPISVEL